MVALKLGRHIPVPVLASHLQADLLLHHGSVLKVLHVGLGSRHLDTNGMEVPSSQIIVPQHSEFCVQFDSFTLHTSAGTP